MRAATAELLRGTLPRLPPGDPRRCSRNRLRIQTGRNLLLAMLPGLRCAATARAGHGAGGLARPRPACGLGRCRQPAPVVRSGELLRREPSRGQDGIHKTSVGFLKLSVRKIQHSERTAPMRSRGPHGDRQSTAGFRDPVERARAAPAAAVPIRAICERRMAPAITLPGPCA